MKTEVLPADAAHIKRAVDELKKGFPVVVPTETVYGLAAPIHDEKAVKRIYEIKGRPQDNPLIIHISSFEQLQELATNLPEYTQELFDMFWPGPLTIVVQAKSFLPHVTAGKDTVAVRMPAHKYITTLIDHVGPLAAPSANTSGRPSPTTAQHALDDLQGKIRLIMDGGEGFHGVESTVLDVSESQPTILRPGVITQDMIEDVIKRPCAVRTTSDKSPGSRHAHYQPKARVIIMSNPQETDVSALGKVLVVSAQKPSYPCTHIKLPKTPQAVAKQLYAWLRRADQEKFDTIILQTVPDTGVGAAVMDRLRRAAKHS